MAFPRLAGHAELGWSTVHDFDSYRARLALHGLRLDALGVGYYRSTKIDWKE